MIPHGEAGYLVPVGALDEAAEAGKRLLLDDELWKRFSDAGRAVAVERFSLDLVIPEYEQFYRTLLKEQP